MKRLSNGNWTLRFCDFYSSFHLLHARTLSFPSAPWSYWCYTHTHTHTHTHAHTHTYAFCMYVYIYHIIYIYIYIYICILSSCYFSEQAPEMMKRLTNGNWTLRDMREQFQAVLKMGPLSNIMNQFPGTITTLPAHTHYLHIHPQHTPANHIYINTVV